MSSKRKYTPMGKQVIITVTMPPELAMLVDEAADRRDMTRSAYLRVSRASGKAGTNSGAALLHCNEDDHEDPTRCGWVTPQACRAGWPRGGRAAWRRYGWGSPRP